MCGGWNQKVRPTVDPQAENTSFAVNNVEVVGEFKKTHIYTVNLQGLQTRLRQFESQVISFILFTNFFCRPSVSTWRVLTTFTGLRSGLRV